MTAPLTLFLGKPGSGKGTQAKLLAEKMGWPMFKSSQRLRELAAAHPHVGAKILSVMAEGGLVPYWFPMHLWLGDILALPPEQSMVIEGAVRRLEEAAIFDDMATWFERPYRVFFLTISDEEMRRRIEKRVNIEGRHDDGSEALAERMQEYEKHTARTLEFFKSRGAYVEIHGEGSVEDIHANILTHFT